MRVPSARRCCAAKARRSVPATADCNRRATSIQTCEVFPWAQRSSIAPADNIQQRKKEPVACAPPAFPCRFRVSTSPLRLTCCERFSPQAAVVIMDFETSVTSKFSVVLRASVVLCQHTHVSTSASIPRHVWAPPTALMTIVAARPAQLLVSLYRNHSMQ